MVLLVFLQCLQIHSLKFGIWAILLLPQRHQSIDCTLTRLCKCLFKKNTHQHISDCELDFEYLDNLAVHIGIQMMQFRLMFWIFHKLKDHLNHPTLK